MYTKFLFPYISWLYPNFDLISIRPSQYYEKELITRVGKFCVTVGIELTYRKTSNISRTLVCNKIVDYSDVVGASPVRLIPEVLRYT